MTNFTRAPPRVAACAGAAPALAAAPLKAADYAKILADPTRPEADRKDDAARKPAEVLEFAQVRPGETVLEIEVGRGWMTELISRAVRPKGKVITPESRKAFAYSGPSEGGAAARTAAGQCQPDTTYPLLDALPAADQIGRNGVAVGAGLPPRDLLRARQGLGRCAGRRDTEGPTPRSTRGAEAQAATSSAMDHAAKRDGGAVRPPAAPIHRIDPASRAGRGHGPRRQAAGAETRAGQPGDDSQQGVLDPTIRRLHRPVPGPHREAPKIARGAAAGRVHDL
jgi:hypothetical protein